MKAIYEYELNVTALQQITIPKNYTILTVTAQYDKPVLSALVDVAPSLEYIMINVYTYAASQLIEKDGIQYVGTYQLSHGAVSMGHVFVDCYAPMPL